MPLSTPRIPYYPTVDKNREGDIENFDHIYILRIWTANSYHSTYTF